VLFWYLIIFRFNGARARAKARVRAINETIKKIKSLEETGFIKFFVG